MNACLSEELQNEQGTLQISRDDPRALWGSLGVMVPAWGVCTSWISVLVPWGKPGCADEFLPSSATIERPGDLARIRERWESLVRVLVGRKVCLEMLHELEIGIENNGRGWLCR